MQQVIGYSATINAVNAKLQYLSISIQLIVPCKLSVMILDICCGWVYAELEVKRK